MNFSFIIITILVFGIIVSGILLLKQSAKKFNLTDEQLTKIKQRNDVLEHEEKNTE